MTRLALVFALLSAMLRAQTAATLTGKVRDQGGSPVANATVTLLPGDREASTGEDGAFTIPSLIPGVYTLTVVARGFVPSQETVTVSGAQTSVEIRMSTVQTSIEVRERVDDFLAVNSVSITKSPQRLLDLPSAVQVIPKAVLEDRQIQDIKDLYRNIAGITDSPYSAMTFRGFTQREVLFNGVRGNPYGSLDSGIDDSGFSTSLGRLTNVEFVEVLRGPSAVLFGAGEPGGVVNFITRKPRQTQSAEFSFRTGSFDRKGGHGEITGPLLRRQNLFYRAAWYQEDQRTFRYNSRHENIHAASGLSWKFLPQSVLGIEYEYIDQLLPAHRMRGIPVNSAGGWLTNREWNAAEPTDFSALQARVFQARVDHSFTSTFRADATLRYLNFDRPERYHEPRGINADGRTMRREFRDQYRANEDWSLTVNGYNRFDLKRLGVHNVVFGVETATQDWFGRYATARERARGGPVPDIDILAPVYGLGNGLFYPVPVYTRQTIVSKRTGVFVQDQIELLPRLQVVLGGRVERLRDEGDAAGTPLRFETTGITGRVGAVWRLLPWMSLFGTFSNSFNRAPALAQTAAANGPHDPETGRQFEGGAKAELANGRVLLTTSVFRIRKQNVLRPDPLFGPNGDNFAAVLPVGDVANQGFEVDVTGRVTKQLSVLLNYAYLDSEIRADRFTPGAVGRPLPNAVRHAAGLFLRYDLPGTKTSFMMGNESRGRRFEPYAGFPAAGYAIWDFGVFQRLTRHIEFRAQLDNAFDKLFATASLFAARAGNMPGNPRIVTFSLHVSTQGRE
jgi:iron complex outermembrane recepter protein